MNEDNIIVTVPDYLYNLDGLDYDDQVDLSSDSSEEPEQYQAEYEDYFIDIVSGVNGISSSVDYIYSQDAATLSELELINNNLVILNDNLSSCFNLMLVAFICLVIKMLFGIFNKYLGLGQA